jgi:fumarylacetoacetase
MTYSINETHDPKLLSWIESANDPTTDFPIQNLPFVNFQIIGLEQSRIGVVIGDQILDLTSCGIAQLFTGEIADFAWEDPPHSLGNFCRWGNHAHWSELRRQISAMLSADNQTMAQDKRLQASILVPLSIAKILLPFQVGDYTDFYCSIHHATNVGKMFRPDNPLLPNYKYMPIGYHGRASSIVLSGTAIRRPHGQTASDDNQPTFGPSKLLDYELEVGLFIGQDNELGVPIPIEAAEDYMLGLCLVNDWSARDIQRWEYQPLGPFLAKSFATSISPWVVTMEALAPFRVPAEPRPEDDPPPLPYLSSPDNEASGGIEMQLEVWLSSAQMREKQLTPIKLSHSNFKDMYWTFAQMLTHYASNGCNLRTGDLLASGTVSGPTPEARGCLLELTARGATPIELPTGEQRSFLQDGDEVILRGYCEREGFRRIGLGECRGIILPAKS